MKHSLAIYLISFLCIYTHCFAQQVLPRDEQAIEMMYEGKRYLKYRQYARAAALFETISQRPFNRVSTAAIYLAGLAYFYDGDRSLAQEKFETLIDQYPRSRYLEEARYHRALLFIRSAWSDRNAEGFKELLDLIDHAFNVGIARDALDAARHYLFYEREMAYLEELFVSIEAHHKLMVLEALCRQKLEVNERAEAKQLYQAYLRREGEASPYLESMFEERHITHSANPSVVKIALMLPLHLDNKMIQYEEEIPAKTKSWLEFYEGFQLAVASHALQSRKKIHLKVLDTQRDLNTTEERLYELEQFFPNVIVGDIFNQPSQLISAWAERRGIPQIIPLSPTFEVNGKYQTFLAHPNLNTRAARMAEYAREVMGLKKLVVWTDQKHFTEIFSNAFITTFDTLGGEVVRIAVDSIYDRGKDEEGAKYEIPTIIDDLRFQQVDGMYIPINNEAIAGLILSQLAHIQWQPKVMGPSHWKKFNRIDRELKEKYKLLFTNTNHYNPAAADYQDFYQQYLKEYNYPPSDFCLLGYDLAMYLMKSVDSHDYSWGMPLSAYIRAQPEYEGIHLNYYFGGTQSNQFVNINEYHESGIRKVNANQWQKWELLDDWKSLDSDSLNVGWEEEAYIYEPKKKNK